MKTTKEKIEELVVPLLSSREAWLVDIQIRGERGETVIQVLVDTDAGISIGACAEISRELGRLTEANDVIQTRYRLEVSSPGLDRPLRLLRQYAKNVGRSFRVRYRTTDGEQTDTLTLKEVAGERLVWSKDGEADRSLQQQDILDCRVVLPW